MIDFTIEGNHFYLTDYECQKVIENMVYELRKLKEENKKLKNRKPEIKECYELNLIKIGDDFHLVHPDVISLIEALQAKSEINFKEKKDR